MAGSGDEDCSVHLITEQQLKYEPKLAQVQSFQTLGGRAPALSKVLLVPKVCSNAQAG